VPGHPCHSSRTRLQSRLPLKFLAFLCIASAMQRRMITGLRYAKSVSRGHQLGKEVIQVRQTRAAGGDRHEVRL